MSIGLLASILIRLLAFIWSLVILNRTRDWRMGFLSVMLALMALRQTLTLVAIYESEGLTVSSLSTEWPGLIVSIMAFLSVFFLGRMLEEHKRAEKALKDSENRYRQAAELTQVGYWVWDEIEDKAITCSEECARIQGVSVEEWVSYKSSAKQDAEWVHPNDRESFIAQNIKYDETKVPFGMEYRFITPTGEIRYARDIAEPEFDENGVHVRTIGSTQDITEQKRLQDQLRQSQKMDAVGQLTGGIAHDFNNILGMILGNLDLLKGQIDNDEGALKRLNTTKVAAQRAATLVKQLLGFSRQQATDVVVSNINQVILGMDSLIKRSITPEVEVDLQYAETLWLTEIHPGDFQDALLNLILNARDAMPDGGRLTIETSNCTLDADYCSLHPNLVAGEYVKLSASDAGTGLTSEQQEKIYEPFYTTKEVGKGTGLGLSMVFGFITRSNGHIDVESEPGRGTTFHLYLPRAAGRRLAGKIIEQKPEVLPRGSETILAVDDEELLLEVIKETLEPLGYRVLTACNGKQALERLAEHPTISLLISDVVMPGGLSGYGLAEQALENRPNLKVLLTSGHLEKAGHQKDGQSKYLMKPYTPDALANQVRSLLGDLETIAS